MAAIISPRHSRRTPHACFPPSRSLVAALELHTEASQVYEIGGPDQVSYGEIMREYARQRGLKRRMIPVPLLTPYLSSLWMGLVTPLYARVGRKLVESLRNPTLISNNLSETVFSIRPRSVREAIARALVNEDCELAETRWSDAFSSWQAAALGW